MTTEDTGATAAVVDTGAAAGAADTTTNSGAGAAELDAVTDPLNDDALGAIYDEISKSDTMGDTGDDKTAVQNANGTGGEPAGDNLQAIEAPVSWTAEMKGKFGALAPDVQAYVAQRERDSSAQISRQGNELNTLRPIGELTAYFKPIFDKHNVDFVTGFSRMMDAQMALDQDPVRGLAAIAETYGVDLAKTFGGQPAQQANSQQRGPVDPAVSVLDQRMQLIEGFLNQQHQDQQLRTAAEERQWRESAQQEIDKWSAGKEHYEAVQGTMATLFEANLATDLDDAYAKAIEYHPDIKAVVDAAKQKEAAAKTRAGQEAAALAAKKAARTNAGTRLAQPAPTGRWNDDANLNRIYDEVSGA